MIARRLTIHGRVQGVFYRDWTVEKARSLGLAGWVRNQAGGTVAAHLEGPEDAVRAMVEAMREGPSSARVERIAEREVAVEGLSEFERR